MGYYGYLEKKLVKCFKNLVIINPRVFFSYLPGYPAMNLPSECALPC